MGILRTSLALGLVAWIAASSAHAQNLVVNGSFDADKSSWNGGAFALLDVDGDPGEGSIRVENPNPASGGEANQRFSITEGAPLRASYCLRMNSGQSGIGYSEFSIAFFEGPCVGGGGYIDIVSAGLISELDVWHCDEIPTFTPPATSQCAQTTLFVRNNGDVGSFGANFDSIFVPEPGAATGAIAAGAALAFRRRARGRAAGACRPS
jgi:hypothetical protein